MIERRDKLGRRIGYNWWRELCVNTWRDAYDAWWSQLEAETALYASEVADFKQHTPTPTLKATMIGLRR